MTRRILWFGAVFGCGLCAGVFVLRATAVNPLGMQEARRRALALLDRPPVEASIREDGIVAASRRISPSVVNIDTVGRVHAPDGAGAAWSADQEVRGKGSGVVLSPDGYIVTNNHVIDGASRIRVTMADGHWYYARLVGRDAPTDLAVVRIDARNLPYAELGDSDRLEVGETCIAVGNPLGLGSTVTSGIISALNRRNLQIDDRHLLDGAIQTDASINRGNSGGALANVNGQLVGINTAILSSGPNGGSIGLGFALPINTVRRIAADLITSGKAQVPPDRMPWVGISYATVSEALQHDLGLDEDRGAEVTRTAAHSPAASAGIRDGDIILDVDGKPIGDLRDVREAIQQRSVGDRCSVRFLRPSEHREHDVVLTLTQRPDSMP
jgi:serine protease Do